MKSSTYTAPAKAILAGEHSGVYGHPMIVIPVPILTTQVTFATTTNNSITIFTHSSSNDINTTQTLDTDYRLPTTDHLINFYQHPDKSHPLSLPLYGLSYLLSRYPQSALSGLKVSIKSSIIPGSGLGSSAALSVALVKSFYSYFKIKNGYAKTYADVIQLESFIHGTPSGADPTCILKQQSILFRKQNNKPSITPIPHISHLPPLALIHTGQPAETTGDMVEYVRAKKLKSPKAQKLLLKLGQLTQDFYNTTSKLSPSRDGKHETSKLINQLGITLEHLGGVSPTVIKFSHKIRQLGGSCKISGDGGRTAGSGLLLATGLTDAKLNQLCQEYSYQIIAQLNNRK